MTTPDVNVVLIDFPTPGKEMVVPNEDGSYTILINARLSDDQRLKSYEHAMKHIQEDDFSKSSVQEIEYKAHNVVIPENAERIPNDKFEKELRRLQKQNRKTKKRLREYEKDIEFLASCTNGYDFIQTSEENRWLYG